MASSDLTAGVMRHHFCCILLADPDLAWEGNTQGPGYRKVWLAGKSSLEASYPASSWFGTLLCGALLKVRAWEEGQ